MKETITIDGDNDCIVFHAGNDTRKPTPWHDLDRATQVRFVNAFSSFYNLFYEDITMFNKEKK